MKLASIRKAGHAPSLVAAFLHFDTSFACWVLIGALGIAISEDLGLSPAAKGLAVGLPLVAGSAFRLVVGPASDRLGPRPVGMTTLAATVVPLLLAWLAARSLGGILLVGALLGIAGASFAVALPLAGRSFDAKHRGLAMGVAGAGNSGTVVAVLLAPRIAAHVGWHAAMGLAVLPVVVILGVFSALTRNTPAGPSSERTSIRRVASSRDAPVLCGYYLVTFGGFVGLVSFLPILLRDRYGLTQLEAGNATALCAVAGSFLRPLGGLAADRLSGERVLPFVYAIAATAAAGVAMQPGVALAVGLLVVMIGALGVGNGAVFQIVPRRFPSDIGSVTGLVGAAGGIGGFLLPTLLGVLRGWTGSYSAGLVVFGAVCAASAATVGAASRGWRTSPAHGLEVAVATEG